MLNTYSQNCPIIVYYVTKKREKKIMSCSDLKVWTVTAQPGLFPYTVAPSGAGATDLSYNCRYL